MKTHKGTAKRARLTATGKVMIRTSNPKRAKRSRAKMTALGLPDFGYLTQTEMAEVARRTCGANPGLDLVVDADTGRVLHEVVGQEAAGLQQATGRSREVRRRSHSTADDYEVRE